MTETTVAEPLGPSRRWPRTAGSLLLLAVAVAAAAIVPSLSGDYVTLVGYQILLYAALGQAWNLIAGYGGLVSLGSAAMIGIGSYGTAKLIIDHDVPLIPAMLAGGLLAGAFAAAVSPLLFRLRGLYFVVGTLVLAEALRVWMVNWNGLGGSAGLFLTNSAPTTDGLYRMALALAAAATLIVVVILRTRLGLGLRAVRDDEDTARQMGLRTFRVKLIAFSVSAFVMGVAGGLQADRLGKIEPYSAYGLAWTVDIVTIVIIGGMGTVIGPLVGAVFVIVLGEKLADHPETHIAITGVILILVIRFAPYGIWGAISLGTRRALALTMRGS